MAGLRICSVEGCGKKHVAKGFCTAHYERLRLGKSLDGVGISPGDRLRFIEDVALPYKGDECLTWPYSRNNMGYGVIYVDGKQMYAHRYVCMLIHGDPPTPKHHAAHICGNGDKGCLSSSHLKWKTASENAADKLIHGTHSRGERHAMSKLTEKDVREIWSLKGNEPQRSIAKRYNVSAGAIQRIHDQKSWSWLTQSLCGNLAVSTS